MKTSLVGGFYNNVITECSIPETVSVNLADYVAKNFNKYGVENGEGAIQQPFLIRHNEPITLRVVTWLGKEVTITFPGDGHPYPMPLRKILNHADNTITENINISY